ncbi:MAG: hypothetical protein FWG45_04595 [Oscillospiraceae bacterium]|nr:hypothetical protein [Oscillospiraceae bacterium]
MSIIKPTPVKSYTAPEIPTLADVKDDSAFLKVLPKRWRKSTAVLACVGLMGGATLTAPLAVSATAVPIAKGDGSGVMMRHIDAKRCTKCGANHLWRVTRFTQYTDDGTNITERRVADKNDTSCSETKTISSWTPHDADGIVFKGHHGGSGFALYVVHFTEAEAADIIRMKLQEAGLTFVASPPEYTATSTLAPPCYCGGVQMFNIRMAEYEALMAAYDPDSGEPMPPLPKPNYDCDWMRCPGGVARSKTLGLNLFDGTNNVAVSVLGYNDDSNYKYTPAAFIEKFEKQSEDITFGVFDTQSVTIGENYKLDFDVYKPDSEGAVRARALARPVLEEKLNEQIEAFLATLSI